MRFLRVLRLGLVHVRLVRHRLGAEVAGDDVAQFGQRVIGDMGGVGTHVADQADRAFLADRETLVQLLRDAHGAAGGEAELARGLLLQRGGDERRRRAALALLAGHVGDMQGVAGSLDQARTRGLGRLAVGDGELFELLPVELDQAGGEGLLRMRQLGFHRPVFARDEGFDLLLALDDHAQGRRLHPAGGQAALYFLPQHRREVEADQVVQGAARLLGVDQVAGDLARVVHGLADRLGGDLGEHHPVHFLVLEQAAFLQDLGDVPADRLAFAIRIGCQEYGGGAFCGFGQGLDMFLVLLDQLVAHREVLVRVDRPFLGHQVADMAVGSQDGEVLAQVLVDRLGLGGRFDD